MTSTTRTAILTGDTYRVRESLARGGWRWDPAREAYIKVAEWDDEADVIRAVRRLPGVRNRGDFRTVLEAR